jgi:hypothetical protein
MITQLDEPHDEDLEYFIINHTNMAESNQSSLVEPTLMEEEAGSNSNPPKSKQGEEISNSIADDAVNCASFDSVEHFVGTSPAGSVKCKSCDFQLVDQQRSEQTHSTINSHLPSLFCAKQKRLPRWSWYTNCLLVLIVLCAWLLAPQILDYSQKLTYVNDTHRQTPALKSSHTEVCSIQPNYSEKCPEQQGQHQMESLTNCKGLVENVMRQLEATVELLQKQDAKSRQLQKEFQKLVQQQIQLEEALQRQLKAVESEREKWRQSQKKNEKQYENIKKDIRRQREVAQKRGRTQKARCQNLREKIKEQKKRTKIERKRRRQLQKLLKKQKSLTNKERRKRRQLERQLIRQSK